MAADRRCLLALWRLWSGSDPSTYVMIASAEALVPLRSHT